MPTPAGLPQYDPQRLLNCHPVIITVIDPAPDRVQFQNAAGLTKLGHISTAPCDEKMAGGLAPCSFCKLPARSDEILAEGSRERR